MKKNEKEKFLRKQKIKNVIFNILHTLGYISMGVVLLCGIGLGVTSCKTKQNKNTSVSEVPYTDVKKDDNPQTIVKYDSSNILVPYLDFYDTWFSRKVWDYFNPTTTGTFPKYVSLSEDFSSQTFSTLYANINQSTPYHYPYIELQHYFNGSDMYGLCFLTDVNHTSNQPVTNDMIISWVNGSSKITSFKYYNSSSSAWVDLSIAVQSRAFKIKSTTSPNLFSFFNSLTNDGIYDNGYGEGESVGYESGYGVGESVGYESGYGDGYSEGLQDGNSYNVDINPNDIDLNQYKNIDLPIFYKDFYNQNNMKLLNNVQFKINYSYIFNFMVYSGLFDIFQNPYIILTADPLFKYISRDDFSELQTSSYLKFLIYFNNDDIVYEVQGQGHLTSSPIYRKRNNMVEIDISTNQYFKYDVDDSIYLTFGYGNFELEYSLLDIPYSYNLDNVHTFNYPLYDIICKTFEIQTYEFVFNQNLNLSAFFTNQFQNSAVSMGSKTIAEINQSCYIVKPGQIFYSNGMYFDTMKIYCTELLDNATYFITSDNTTPRKWNLSGYMYPMMLTYENSVNGDSVTAMVINYVEREGGYSVYLGSYSWTNESYKYVSFLDKDYKPVMEFFTQNKLNTYQLLNNALNSNIGNSVSANLGTSNNNVFTLLKSAFSSLVPIFSMSLMPGITIGILLFLPLVVGIIILVFKLLRK